MADPPPPQAPSNPTLNTRPFPPSSHPGSSVPFTPRSSTFPDELDSDSDFDVLQPTPLHSPGGPRYDDLPPTYDEAQQQALQDACAGVPPLDLNSLDIHRTVLGHDQAQPQPQPKQRQPDELEPTRRRNGPGLGTTVPIQHVDGAERIPVGRVVSGNAQCAPSSSGSVAPDPRSVLLDRALEFTRHQPATDSQFTPHLTRPVAIPQTVLPCATCATRAKYGRGRRCGRRDRCGRRGDRYVPHVPGQWPEATSKEALEVLDAEAPVQFLRAYAKALHAHAIRPAEFAEFLDGLNALCVATNTSSRDLADGTDSSSALVHEYIHSANETFFAPRGLGVSLTSLPALVHALKIPEHRGQRAGALASASDAQAGPEQRAQALHPWVEALDTNVPSSGTQALLHQDMNQHLHHRPEDAEAGTAKSAPQDTNLDPPHSLPRQFPTPSQPPFPRWDPHTHPFNPWARGPPWRTPFNPLHHTPWTPSFNPSSHHPGQNQNNWAAWGTSIGQWGEEFGKRMGEWGEQVGRRAEEAGRQAGDVAEGVGRQAGSVAAGSRGTDAGVSASGFRGRGGWGGRDRRGALPGDKSCTDTQIDASKSKTPIHDNDDDASSISSSSSSSSSSDTDTDTKKLPQDTNASSSTSRNHLHAQRHKRKALKRETKALLREIKAQGAQDDVIRDVKAGIKQARAEKRRAKREERRAKREARKARRDGKSRQGVWLVVTSIEEAGRINE